MTLRRLRERLPYSFKFFFAAVIVFVLQVIPFTGIFLMFLMAPFWSVVLINVGMIGIAYEVWTGRAARRWSLLPLVFYAGYWTVAVLDRATLFAMSNEFDAHNSQQSVAFDPVQHALVFANDDKADWLIQNYDLPVAYSLNKGPSAGFVSVRMIEKDACDKIRHSKPADAPFVDIFGFHDGDSVGAMMYEQRFCILSMPEKPELPAVWVRRHELKFRETALPVSRVETTITMPDDSEAIVLGGVASPLKWLPMPVMGCFLHGLKGWQCDAQFLRDEFTPIVSGDTRYRRDQVVLAKALGLKRVAIADRKGADPPAVLAQINDVEEESLKRQLANIDRMIADPAASGIDWQVGMITTRRQLLVARSEAIMTGLEQAAQMAGASKNRHTARDNGLILGRLIGALPRNRVIELGPRILALYAKAGDDSWLWESEELVRRLGDLGTVALPHLINVPGSIYSRNGAEIEGLCRIGGAGRAQSEPALLAIWRRLKPDGERDLRELLFVAMRRIGVTLPSVADETREELQRLQTKWADITPQSLPRVCAVRAERQARKEEKFTGARQTNVD